jgi:hypothetical protein
MYIFVVICSLYWLLKYPEFIALYCDALGGNGIIWWPLFMKAKLISLFINPYFSFVFLGPRTIYFYQQLIEQF